MRRLLLVAATAFVAALGATSGVAVSQDAKMSFFITSVGSGKGTDLGGLKGADAHCASLAEAAGVTGKSWHAYLSTSAEDARDRIGKGPWFNAEGVKIADDVASLHSDANGITKQTALDEKGEVVNGRGDTPNRHDMLTGSKPDGTRIADQTCGDWTMSGAEGAAMMGHHDRTGLDDSAAAKSWNSSHASRGGCSQEALKGTGGDGLFYCFATN
ncbi:MULTISPECIES: hypothetical protein [unclassified Mesorhizobium]|uniref:hypothetical protein n=1 Tax=unclassified Mesorhizobium TaxID=325217 RepID=UPI000BAF1D40|nr:MULTISPECIES: hypothetical protein [unclassified Mesorhizobium]PBB28473.1 hypothetical protein CK232_03215 [Mesorhizobium sp. WSM4304]PBB73603.1 hypothetical protein CK227_19170 [Mesorhizobium sp. WSM4308]